MRITKAWFFFHVPCPTFLARLRRLKTARVCTTVQLKLNLYGCYCWWLFTFWWNCLHHEQIITYETWPSNLVWKNLGLYVALKVALIFTNYRDSLDLKAGLRICCWVPMILAPTQHNLLLFVLMSRCSADSSSLWCSWPSQESLVPWETGADHSMGRRVSQHDGPFGPSSGLLLWGLALAE